jgi:hypothetical protein
MSHRLNNLCGWAARPNSGATTMVKKDSVIQFCRTCLEWAEQATCPSDRQIIVNVARSWLETARLVDDRVLADHEARLN